MCLYVQSTPLSAARRLTSALLVGLWFLNGIMSEQRVMYKGLYTDDISRAHETMPQRVSPSGKHMSHNLTCYNHEGQVNFNVSIGNKQYLLHLQPSSDFVAPGIIVERWSSNIRKRYKPSHEARSCHFHGVVHGHKNSQVALSTCNGLIGMIHTEDGKYYIEPAHQAVDTIGPGHKHLIYKRSAVLSTQPRKRRHRKQRKKKFRNCGTKDPKKMTILKWRKHSRYQLAIQQMTSHKNKTFVTRHSRYAKNCETGRHKKYSRRTRSVSVENYVETLVVADSSMLEFHEDGDIETYLLSMMNTVASIYKNPSIGNLIQIVVVKVILLEDPLSEPRLNITINAQYTLKDFCIWQHKINPMDDSDPEHYDTAILVTRKNICANENVPCNTLGVAYIRGMCNMEKSCSINKDTGITLAHTVAHEMGHSFGMLHDTEKIRCNGEYGSKLHIMSRNFQPDIVDVGWSSCSRREITNFLDMGFGKCLIDKPAAVEYTYPELPAGALYNEHYQCELQFGEKSRGCASNKEEICKRLWCIVDGVCITQMIPAAPGTTCGKHKWCQQHNCTAMMDPHTPVAGGWGEWSPWTECSRTCGGGVSLTERQCDNPVPSDGGRYCVGDRRRISMCNTDPCSASEPSFRAVQCSKYDHKPYEGSMYKWQPYFDQANQCKLLCSDANATVIVPWEEYVIDGTPCNVGTRDVCVAGICKKVGCDWVVDSNAQHDECGICEGDGTRCDKISGSYHKDSSFPGYREVVVIPTGAHNIRIREMNRSENYISIGSAVSRKFYLNGNRHITLPGEYMVAGAQALYTRHDQLEEIRIPGPIKESIVVYVLFRGEINNADVEYKYSMWKRGTTEQLKYAWGLGLWSQCSATCGGGTQHKDPFCQEIVISSLGSVLNGTATFVDEMMCDTSQRPLPKIRSCNSEPCATFWWVGPWQSCPETCTKKGEALWRRRSVMCIDGQEMALPDLFCNEGTKPPEYTKCLPLPPCAE